LHRSGGDIRKGAISGLPWLKRDLAASGNRPIILFQYYGWDQFSTERWDPATAKFSETGSGAPHWWSKEERQALIETVDNSNVIGVFHGHQHETPMIYRHGSLDLFKPKAAFLGGFALAKLTPTNFYVVLGEPNGDSAGSTFTHAFQELSRPLFEFVLENESGSQSRCSQPCDVLWHQLPLR
jgi:cytolysin (calcineurin-like family phosphatase)